MDLIKIDVESMEANVIRGAVRTLSVFRPVIWTENTEYFDSGDTSFIALLDELDYTCAKAAVAPNDLICQHRATLGEGGSFSLTQ